MAEAANITNNDHEDVYGIHIRKRNNETSQAFAFRKNLYDKIFNDIKDEEKALIYSNIWVNVISLGCTYPTEVMSLVEKYKPKNVHSMYEQE
jgi:hypothetical protein